MVLQTWMSVRWALTTAMWMQRATTHQGRSSAIARKVTVGMELCAMVCVWGGCGVCGFVRVVPDWMHFFCCLGTECGGYVCPDGVTCAEKAIDCPCPSPTEVCLSPTHPF